MKGFTVYNIEPPDIDDDADDIDDDSEQFASFQVDTLRALQSITSKRGTGGERETCDEAMTSDALSSDQVATIRRLETEFAREIAEFKAARRPIRETINDETPAAI